MLDTEASIAVADNSPGKMPFCRQKRPHLSSAQTSQMEVEGTTMLCLPTDHAWFQGTINTDDDSTYSLYGQRLETDIGDEYERNNNKGEEDQVPSYKVTLTDHFTAQIYHLPNITIHLDPKSPSLLTCERDAQVKFKVENVYKGQKADMMIQRCGGYSTLLGKKCLVYYGPISLLFQDTVTTGRNWCL